MERSRVCQATASYMAALCPEVGEALHAALERAG